MQTFLPYPCFRRSMECLDNQRLGKQRVEAMQILNALQGRTKGWVNHPATLMWRGYEPALRMYLRQSIVCWTARGFRNAMEIPEQEPIQYPRWFGDPDFHASHRSNLLRKKPSWYSQFKWVEPYDLEYVWPVKKAEAQ
jgi:hypothetical protein